MSHHACTKTTQPRLCIAYAAGTLETQEAIRPSWCRSCGNSVICASIR